MIDCTSFAGASLGGLDTSMPEQVELGMELRVRFRHNGKKVLRRGEVVKIDEDYLVLSRNRHNSRIAFADVVRLERSRGQMEKLNKYARFPQGLTSGQMGELLEHYRQTEFRRIF